MIHNLLVCSACGMRSGRKSNVRRHIQNIHRGNGEILLELAYLIKILRSELPFPSYNRPSNFLSADVGKPSKTPSQIIVERSFVSIKHLACVLAEKRKHLYDLAIRAESCKNCLTHKLFWFSIDNKDWRGIEAHACDPAWILDNRAIVERKDEVIALLDKTVPDFLAKLFCEMHSAFGYRTIQLLAETQWSDDISRAAKHEEQMREPLRMIAERLEQPLLENGQKALPGPYQFFLSYCCRAYSKVNIKDERDVINLEGSEAKHWLAAAVSQGHYEMNYTELAEFFALTRSSSAIVMFSGKRIRLHLQF